MDVLIYSGIHFATGWGLLALDKKVRKEQKEYDLFSNAHSYTPSGLLHLFYNHGQEGFRPNPRNLDEVKMTTFVEGEVDTLNPIMSRMKSNSKLIYSYHYQGDLYSNDDKMSFKRLKPLRSMGSATFVSDFVLRDPNDILARCRVEMKNDVDVTNALETIAIEKNTPEPFTWTEKVQDYFSSLLESSAQLAASAIAFRGIRLGYTETELGIRLNSQLAVFGEVIFDKVTKSMKIESPLLFLNNKDQFIKNLGNTVATLKVGRVVLAVVFLGSGIMVWKRLFEMYKDWKAGPKVAIVTGGNGTNNEVAKMACVNCHIRKRSVVTAPCQHLCLCLTCFESMNTKVCPMCEEKVAATTTVLAH
jgi:hypothetical protein